MKSTDIIARLGVARARIEAAASGPSVLAITSALASDGTEFLASALAECLTLAGHSVLLVAANESAARVSTNATNRTPTNITSSRLELTIGPSQDSYSLEAARAAFELYRSEYAFTIIDAPAALASGSALAFARAADFVLIAFEEGRSARTADRELAKNLAAAGASLLGVVTIDPKTIRALKTSSTSSVNTTHLRPVQSDELPKRSAAFSTTTG